MTLQRKKISVEKNRAGMEFLASVFYEVFGAKKGTRKTFVR